VSPVLWALVIIAGLIVGWMLASSSAHLYREHGRALSPMYGGTPKNIRRTRPRLEVFRAAAPPGWHCHVTRARWADVSSRFNGAYRAAWCSWELVACAFGRLVIVRHWSERQLS
jgi:hypothetical protein